MLINIWNIGDAIVSSNSTLYCKHQDKEALKVALLNSGFFPKAYSVSANGEDILPFVDAYVNLNRIDGGSSASTISYIYQAPLRCIIDGIEFVNRGFRESSSDLIKLGCDWISDGLKITPVELRLKVPASLQLLINFIRDFVDDCFRPLELGSPFIHFDNTDQRKNWWLSSAELANRLRSAKARLRAEFGASPTGLIIQLENWIVNVEQRLRNLQAITTSNNQKQSAILEASAYCSALAERHLLRNQRSLAVLLLHRSTDLLLLSICVGNSAIDFSRHGGRYRVPPVGVSNTITLLNSLDSIKPTLAADVTRDSAFSDLNKWRNLLIHAHYMSELDEQSALLLFLNTRPHLERLGGSSWQAARKAYLEGINSTASAVLDVDGWISRSVSELVY